MFLNRETGYIIQCNFPYIEIFRYRKFVNSSLFITKFCLKFLIGHRGRNLPGWGGYMLLVSVNICYNNISFL